MYIVTLYYNDGITEKRAFISPQRAFALLKAHKQVCPYNGRKLKYIG